MPLSHRVLLFQLFLVINLAGFNTHASVSSMEMTDVITPHVRASLLSEQDSIVAGQSFWVAVNFDIIDGWHTYWQNPGDSGNPPHIQWQLPPGFVASPIHWPYPQRLPVGPLMNYGYSQEAWLLVRMTVPAAIDPGQITLKAKVDWLVCQETCIPEQGQFSLVLRVAAPGAARPSLWQPRIQAILQRLPQPLPWPSRIQVKDNEIDLRVQLDEHVSLRLQDVYFFADEYGIAEHAADQIHKISDRELSLRVRRGDLKGSQLNTLQGVLVVSEALPDGTITRAFEVRSPVVTDSNAAHLSLILSFAILGGLLLNVMPCVFPILSLKAVSIVQTAARSPVMARRNAYVFTLGVLISFAVIATVLLVLRAGGEAIGWGFQLQSPVFVLTLTWLIFAMGLQFSGVWSFGESWGGLGQNLASYRTYLGTFFTGVLAVIVATPCTAPFMGTALGYALNQPAWISLMVFICLGFGMALPWLLISLWPGMARYLPKPGVWMERVKQVLAFPLYATVAWLLWVLAQQVDKPGLLYAQISLVFVALGLWFWQNTRSAGRGWRVSAVTTLLLVIGLMGSLLWKLEQAASVSSDGQNTALAYDASALARYRAEGKPVLVNFTAAWCITCLVNEKAVLNSTQIQKELRDKTVVYMKGDWTNQDPAITQVLAQYGRSGVPLYLLFPADLQREAIILPNILTRGIVLQSLNQLNE
ncbi:MAG: protein-disulfide reductase DsbD domain-containing protein [Gammaproteobacteria bacterium]